MKKYLVIGNPISHSMSPELHNYWLKENKILGVYERQKLKINELEKLVLKIKNKKVIWANVTVPFKKKIIPYLDKLTPEAQNTQSVNTIFLDNDRLIGHNTDISGFEKAIKDTKYNLAKKKILILGAGGVVSSIIFALHKMKVFSVTLSNRTKTKAENLKSFFNNTIVNRNKITVIDWGEIPNFDMVINATSVGLKNNDKLNLDFSKIEKENFFYDVIYNPEETNFLKSGKKFGCKIENGKKMFIYQAAEAFKIWHGIYPKINHKVIGLLNK